MSRADLKRSGLKTRRRPRNLVERRNVFGGSTVFDFLVRTAGSLVQRGEVSVTKIRWTANVLRLLGIITLAWAIGATPLTAQSEALDGKDTEAEKPVGISHVSLEEGYGSDSVLLVILMDSVTEPRIFYLENPPRVVVDVASPYAPNLPKQLVPSSADVIRLVRVGVHKDKLVTRFVLDLEETRTYEASSFVYSPDRNGKTAKLVVKITKLPD
jgi:hypothetical protein